MNGGGVQEPVGKQSSDAASDGSTVPASPSSSEDSALPSTEARQQPSGEPTGEVAKSPQDVHEILRAQQIRTWTDATGEFSAEARFGGMTGTTVTLHRKDGTTIKIDVQQLSDTDRKWIESRRMHHR
jgi:hypothetical protein